MKYKVHTAYINNNGTIIPIGVYDESEIDVTEARYKSLITLADIELETTIRNREDLIIIKNIKNPSYEEGKDFNEIKLEPKIEIVEVKRIDINKAIEDTIASIKYVSKTTAKKVIAERNIKPFTSYVDLDRRVPLSFSKKWQDVSALVFTVDETIEPSREYTQLV